MGCSVATFHSVESKHLFTSNEITLLKQSWNVIKGHDLHKFVQNILIKTTHESRSFRQFCISKVQVDGNNYDYGQHDSCLRTDLSWQIALPDYSVEVNNAMEKFLAAISKENNVNTYVQLFPINRDSFPIEHETLLIMKRCTLNLLHERFQSANRAMADDYTHVWDKVFTLAIDHVYESTTSTTEIIMRMNISNK
ncbi:unnamed protein product [Adineta ricciae]|uniref:Uncharacterized protein n=1 Tax=Adineta ricciae TaxID=249248 RepID=A0A814IY99_ADIRI|nr:unnamed protein product [Adineta ricciae]